MSIQAVAWALEYQDLPLDKRTGRMASAAKLVLIALANHAGPDGCDAFPSVDTIERYTGLSERAVRYTLDALEAHGTIAPTPNPLRRDTTISRGDKRPVSYDLVAMPRGANSAPTGCKVDGSRGAKSGVEFAPEPSLEPKEEREPKDSCSAGAERGSGALFGVPLEAGVEPPANGKSRRGSRSSTQDPDGALFDEFWVTYPRKIGKGQARKAWGTATKKTDPRAIITAARRYAASRKGEDPTFTPHPSTWLNGERWNDEPEHTRNSSAAGGDRRGGVHRPYRDPEDMSAYLGAI